MGNGNTSFIESRIGNPFFASGNSDGSQTSQLLSEFKMVSVYEDNLFKKCSIIEHKDSHQLIIAKEIDCQSEIEMEKTFNEFEKRKETLLDQNLIRLRYTLKKKTDGLFSDEYKVVLFFDYVLTNLEQQSHNRLNKKIAFSPDEINIIMCGAIRGYAALQQLKITNDKVRIKNIYFGLKDKDPFVKVIDTKLFPTPTNLEAIRTKDQTQDVFLAPEQLKQLNKTTFTNNFDTKQLQKYGVFSLGIIMMELCLLTPSKQLYDYNNRQINYNQMQTRLNIIKNKYPLSVFYLIRSMTQRNEESRPSFTKLRDNLPTNIKNLTQAMTLSVVGKSNSYHLNPQTKLTKLLPPSGYTKIINPTSIDPNERKMQSTTLVSQYRPNVDASEVYTNGNMYTGQKKDNLRHGKGKYLYSDGSYYYGDWFKGKMEGHGQLYNSNGDLEYEGEWKDDHYNGRGLLKGTGVDWIKYEGQFVNGRMEGFGQMQFKDGNRYKGDFRADFPWGKGRMLLKNGSIQSGLWEKGNYVGQI